MNVIRIIFLVTAVAAAVAVAPVALAGTPTPAEVRALEIRGQALNQACLDPAQPRAAFRALCTYEGAQNQPTPAELKALEIRGQALNQACLDPAQSRAAFRGVCTYAGTQTQPTRVDASSSGLTGFVRWASNPASLARRWSLARPYPVIATSNVASPPGAARTARATS